MECLTFPGELSGSLLTIDSGRYLHETIMEGLHGF